MADFSSPESEESKKGFGLDKDWVLRGQCGAGTNSVSLGPSCRPSECRGSWPLLHAGPPEAFEATGVRRTRTGGKSGVLMVVLENAEVGPGSAPVPRFVF